jgi:hypothetical protein
MRCFMTNRECIFDKQIQAHWGRMYEELPNVLSTSKVFVVDVTHYTGKPDMAIYFALGLSHAMGRDTVPITNRAKYRDISQSNNDVKPAAGLIVTARTGATACPT